VVDRDRSLAINDALDRIVAGDATSLDKIATVEQSLILTVAQSRNEPLVVSRSAVIAVLVGLMEGTLSPSEAQAWASFVRRGFIANRSKGPIRAVGIEYEAAWEDAIVEAVGRLDEIGDIIDGEVTDDEALSLIRGLGEQ
jgi:hypothetical protein